MKTMRHVGGGGKKKKTKSATKSKSMEKEFKIIEKKKTKQTTLIWMESFNKILDEIKKKIEKTKFINEHSYTQFLKVYKPYVKIKNIVEKLKAAGDSTMSVKMFAFERKHVIPKLKEIEQQDYKKKVLAELKKKKSRAKSLSPKSKKGSKRMRKRSSANRKRSSAKSKRSSPSKRRRSSAKRKRSSAPSSPRKKTKRSSILKSSMSLPNFDLSKSTPETPKTADLPKLVFRKPVL